jgi:hypothetical protein
MEEDGQMKSAFLISLEADTAPTLAGKVEMVKGLTVALEGLRMELEQEAAATQPKGAPPGEPKH